MVLHRVRQSKSYLQVVAFTKRYERFWVPLMLVGGLTADVLQYNALNIWEKFAVMGVYLFVSTSALVLLNDPHASERRGWRSLRLVAPFLHQFSVGGLLATSLLFYWFGGSVSVSWPIFLVLGIFILSNEFFRKHFLRPTVQVAVLSFSVCSLSAILFSFIFNSLSETVFLLSSLVSLCFMLGFVLVLTRVGHLLHRRQLMVLTVLGVFTLMSSAYFGNIIPPIPLSIRQAGIYDTPVSGSAYDTLNEAEESWIDRLIPGQTLTMKKGQPLYAFTSIFAPGDLSTTMVHRWQYYNNQTHDWEDVSVLSYPMVGGRDDGYRGYTRKTPQSAGKWRVSVETPRGQVLGRIPFTVVFSL